MVGDQLLRGTAGAAGELGWMPVPGAAASDGGFDRSRHEVGAAFQALVGWRGVQELAKRHRIAAEDAAQSVAAAAGSTEGAAFLDELARRIALGVASICTVLDPELVVLDNHVGSARGDELAGRVQRTVADMILLVSSSSVSVSLGSTRGLIGFVMSVRSSSTRRLDRDASMPSKP
ncbi:ROK family protein [Nonomuraea purpurea]|uniref:ROK family protein n=1 Tax=Nonomuraea purpurea TaxID=1849276 RepID=A0ABV8G5V4_9ACTN